MGNGGEARQSGDRPGHAESVPRITIRRSRPRPWAADAAVIAGDTFSVCAAALLLRHQPGAFLLALAFFVTAIPTQQLRLVPSLRIARSIAPRVVAVSALAMPVGVLLGNWRWPLVQAGLTLLLLVGTRGLVYWAIRRLRRGGRLVGAALLVAGDGRATHAVSRLLREHPEAGLKPVVATDASVADLLRPRSVILTSAVGPGSDTRRLLRRVLVGGASVYLEPELAKASGLSPLRQENLNGASFERLPSYPMHRPSWRIKRLLDVGIAAVGIALLLPILVTAALGVKLSSSGPVLFRQRRVGRFGTRFTMYKFRTFPVDHVDDKFSRDHDECPSRFGRFLRRTSIDELPQLFNVLNGEMSIVGPRPERPHFAEPFTRQIAEYDDRHRVPGGITGAAQVQGLCGNCSVRERVRADNHYIDDWSLWRDFTILLRTALAIVRKGRPSSRERELTDVALPEPVSHVQRLPVAP